MNPHLTVWDIDAADFPEQGLTLDKLRFLLRYAILAPSSHNSQPWVFTIRENQIELYADRSRSLHCTDPEDRQMLISCGCALHHLLVAAMHFSIRLGYEVLPDPEDPDLLARVGICGSCFPADDNEGLFEAIPQRRTNRQLFRDESLPHGLMHKLKAAAENAGAWLRFAETRDQREVIADLVADGDRLQWANKRFRLELAAWTHPSSAPASDGIPGYAMGSGDLLSVAGPMVIRTFDLGDGQAAKDRDIARYSPGLAALGTAGDEPGDWLAAGQALSHVLLLARQHNVYASFLNQPIENAALRPRLAAALAVAGQPQVLLRLGYGPHVSPTPRRTVDEVTV